MTGYPELELYIDGRWKRADGHAVLNPADETVLGTVPSATIGDLDDAIAAAERGFKVWRKTSPARRTQIILKAASLIRERVNEMAVRAITEQGKPIEQARLEILRGCDIIEWDATEGLRMYGRVIPSEDGMRHTVLRQPIGPVAAFSPWNFPMSSPGRKVAGALSSGCSIILKASEETPAGAVQLVRAFHDAGLSPGVLNLVFGNPAEISEHLSADLGAPHHLHGLDPGRQAARRDGGPLMKPAIMELGGHAPVIVCDDVDPAVAGGDIGDGPKSRNAGQVCVSPDALLRQEGRLQALRAMLRDKAAQLKVGDGARGRHADGPLANQRRVDGDRESFVADAGARGAKVLAAASASANSG